METLPLSPSEEVTVHGDGGLGELHAMHLAAVGLLDTLPTNLKQRAFELREQCGLRLVVDMSAPLSIAIWADSSLVARWLATQPSPPVVREFLAMVGLVVTRGLQRLTSKAAGTVAGALASGAWSGKFSYELGASPAARFQLVGDDRTVQVFEVHAGEGGLH